MKNVFFIPVGIVIALIFLIVTVPSQLAIAVAQIEEGFVPLGIRLNKQRAVVGNILILEFDISSQGRPLNDLTIHFLNQILPSFHHPVKEDRTRICLIPIPYKSTPGISNISLEWSDEKRSHKQLVPIAIQKGHFPSEKLNVTASRVIPPQKELKRIKREQLEIKEIYSYSEPLRSWNSPFQRPTDGKVTSPYGSQRLLNGQLHRYHSGVDFRAPLGTPIFAANTGVVRLAKNLYYSGNQVVLDHGEGLFTSYSHLSRIDVRKGQWVEKGQMIGQSGATGRVSGPHLHWVVKLHGVNVDPLGFIATFNALFDN
jgi:hypothetical protein